MVRITMTTIKVEQMPHARDLPLPARMSSHASGCDVCAAVQQPLTIAPGARALIPTGLKMEIPPGYEVQVRSRSGLAIKHGVMALNSPGTVDADYRGEVKVILANLGDAPFNVARGDRIAQLVPAQVALDIHFEGADNLSETPRGSGGFGSSGIISR
jgi:dUTP pyrophosphatase